MRVGEKYQKINLSESIYKYCLIIWSILNILFNYTTLSEKLGIRLSSYLVYVDYVVILALVFKVFLDNKFIKNQFIISILLIISGLLVYFSSGSRTILMLMFFIIASNNIDINNVLNLLYKFELVTFIFITLLSLLNIIPNRVSLGSVTVEQRYCLGFVHPNSCGFVLINIILLHFYLHRKHIVWYDYILLFIAFFIDYRWPKSKTVYYVLIIVFIAFIILKISSLETKKLFASFLRFIPFIIIVFIVMILIFYNYNQTFSESINSLFSQRLNHMIYYINNYSPKLFGQNLNIVSTSKASTLNEAHVLDNAYLNCLLGYGIVVTIALLLGYYILLKKSIIKKDYGKLAILICIFVWGFSETAMIKLECNSLLILFSGCLYGESDTRIFTGLVKSKCQA